MQLPKVLAEIKDYCGEECMWAVWQAYGGVYVCVPASLKDDAVLIDAIGFENAKALVECFARETLSIPKFDYVEKARRLERNRQIVELKAQGKTQAQLAREFKLTDRQIRNVLAAGGAESPQVDLFG